MAPDPAPPLTFTQAALDRAAHRRADAAWFAAALDDPRTRFVVVRERAVLTGSDGAALTMTRDALPFDPGAGGASAILLGLDEAGAAAVALRLDAGAAARALGDDAPFADLRTAGAVLGDGEAALAAYACALDHWHTVTGHCSACGARTDIREAGHVRRCTDDACGRQHFPRIDPAVIVRIIHPDPDGDRARDRILLARQASWQAGRYSVLAGFCEPGESLEQTVRREMFEEAGVRVADIRYVASQPWPFPSSLMVGFEARALDDSLDLSQDELEDAQWLTRDDARAWEADGKVLSSKISISYRLIRDWLEAGA